MENELKSLQVFRDRMKKIGIDVEFIANLPWLYLHKINGKIVKERYLGEHGFTIAFLPVRRDRPFHFNDLDKIFKLIRIYSSGGRAAV